jgi:hypothetical protein
MDSLRRALYLEAAVWTVTAAGLLIAPRFFVVRAFGQPEIDVAWLRLLGLEMLGLAMFMVLVAQNAERLWWWSWAFALITIGTAAVALFHAAFGLAPGQSSGLWWATSAVTVVLSLALLWGLFVSFKEQPFPG